MTPYYSHAGITIYHGDCREILPTLTADVLVTDPPYGLGIDTAYASRGRGNGQKRRGRALCRDHPRVHGDDAPFDPAHLLRVCQSQILWGANHYADKLPASPMWLAWDRVSGTSDTTDAELAWVRGHRFKTVRLFQHQWCGVLRASENAEPSLHPTQKPVALMRWCLEFFPDGDVVDPYCGSGPVLRAAKDLGRRAIGIEIEERYCEIAAKRMEQEVLFGVQQ